MVLSRGGRLAILNIGDTPYDEVAHLRLRGSAGDELAATLAALDGAPAG